MQTSSTSGTDAQKPRKLGRGLSALLGTTPPVSVGVASAPSSGNRGVVSQVEAKPEGQEVIAPGERVIDVGVDEIQRGRFQPRRVFDEEQLKELAASIKSAGVVQPVVLRQINGAGLSRKYEMIAGERRWRAAQLAGLKTIPALVRKITEAQGAEWALIENLQRADLTSMERAEAIRKLCQHFELTHQQAADKLGMERSTVANLIRLTELEEPIRVMLDEGKLSPGHGKALLGAPAGTKRIGLATIAANQGWSVRKLEQAAVGAMERAANPEAEKTIVLNGADKATARAAALRDLEKQLGEHLGTAVEIRTSGTGKRGSIVAKFYDLDHFDGLMGKMGFILK